MKEIKIAQAIFQGRKAKGITQETLAHYLGVSKASVSKWETGQSYPDITFLPQLATYFNVSIDDLLGYEPQMTKEEIRHLYHQFSRDFTALPFEEVMEACGELIQAYYSCYPLLMQMAILYLNHLDLAATEERRQEILREIEGLCIKIKNESQDLALQKQAVSLEALCALSLGNPATVIDLLEPVNSPWLGDELLVASAHFALRDPAKAKETLQIAFFQHLMAILAMMPNYLMYHTDDAAKYDTIMDRVLELIETFKLKDLHPAVLFPLYLTGAHGYLVLGDETKALASLERYVELATADIYPLEFSGDDFFDQVDAWFAHLDLGRKPPRHDLSIRTDIVAAITLNPNFAGLKGNSRFEQLVKRLETLRTRGD